MTRKILAGGLIFLSSFLFILSMVGIQAAWFGNTPLTRLSLARIQLIDTRLAEAQIEIQNARAEVERSLRIIDSAEEALAPLTGPAEGSKKLLDGLNSLLDDNLIPGLQTTQENIGQVIGTIEDLQAALEQANTIPFVELDVPGEELLVNSLAVLQGLYSELANIQNLAQGASSFLGDTSYLLGGDFSQTRQHLEDFLVVLKDYESQAATWRSRTTMLIDGLPGWIDLASVILTLCLLWSGFSQFGLLLHGMELWNGGNPFRILSRKK